MALTEGLNMTKHPTRYIRQCEAKIKSGNRCKIKDIYQEGYCYDHYHLSCVGKVEDHETSPNRRVKW